MSKFTTSPPAWMQGGSGGASASGGGVSLVNLSASVGIDAGAFSSGITSIQSSINTLNDNITEMLTLIGDIAVNTQSTLMLLSADASDAAVAIAAAVEGASDEEIADAQAGIAALKEMYGETAETAESISDATDDIGEAVDNGSFSFETLASKASAALNTIKNIASAIWDVGASLVETASDREMNERQFNAVFAGMEGNAVALLSDLAESTGLYETIIRDNMSKAYLQFKSAGLDEYDAIAATAHAINYAADAAAMYGTSMDDATQRLLSFMRGNVEAGEAIGLFAGMGSRDEFASRLFDGAKWKDLDEAQRHLALLAIAQQTYTNANVHGKSAEYADSYAISLQNLKARVEELKAALGEPIMDAVTPIIEELSAWIDANPDAVQALADAIASIAESLAALAVEALSVLQDNPEAVTDFFDTIASAAAALMTLLEMLGPIVAWVADKIGFVGGRALQAIQATDDIVATNAMLYGTSNPVEQAIAAGASIDDTGNLASALNETYRNAQSVEELTAYYAALDRIDALGDPEKFNAIRDLLLLADEYGDLSTREQKQAKDTYERRYAELTAEMSRIGMTDEEIGRLRDYIHDYDVEGDEFWIGRGHGWKKNAPGAMPTDAINWVLDHFDFSEPDANNGISGKIDALPDKFSSAITAALPSALAGIGVYMDGQLVGHLVAPTVMGDMARSARNNMHTGTNT